MLVVSQQESCSIEEGQLQMRGLRLKGGLASVPARDSEMAEMRSEQEASRFSA